MTIWSVALHWVLSALEAESLLLKPRLQLLRSHCGEYQRNLKR